MDLRLILHRGLTFAIAMAVSLLPVAALIAFTWPRLSLHLGSDELVVLLIAVAIVSLMVPMTRDMAGRVLDRYVYRTHANYQRTVREASRALTRVLDLSKLLSFIKDTVATSTQAEGVAIYLRDDEGFRSAIVATRRVGPFESPGEAPPVVVDCLAKREDVLLADEIAREEMTPATRAAHEALTRLNWALVLPLLSENALIGMIAVGPKLSGDPFYPQDLDLLLTLANQAGIAIKNAQLYAQVVLANEYIENIVATIKSGVIAIRATGRVAMFNRAAEHLTGLAADDVRAQDVTALPPRLAAALARTVADGQSRTEPEISLYDGRTARPVICTTSPLRDPGGTVLGAVAVFSDLTPLKELEIERRRAERLAYFEVLAAGIAHEIKNPLVSIKTFAQLIPRRHDDGEFVDKFSRIVTREIERMERLLERLRALSRPGERPRQPLDVRAPITEALEFLEAALEEKRLTITVALGETPRLVLGNHAELEELFLNLLINAREATPSGGSIAVDLMAGEASVSVTVADTGPGIPAELLERVFDPFFTTKQQGSGLGLAICAGISQTHRAKLRAANRGEGGAVFTVELPLVTPVSSSALA